MKDSEAVDDPEKTGVSTEKKKKTKKKKKKKDDPTEVVESTEPLVTGPRWPFLGDPDNPACYTSIANTPWAY